MDRLPTRSAAGASEYTLAVAHETLRLRPVLPLVLRTLAEPMTIGGIDLPAGVKVAPSIIMVHRREDIYPDPHAFRPERFVGVKPGTYTWIPFGGGVRRCLGAAFALFEMQVRARGGRALGQAARAAAAQRGRHPPGDHARSGRPDARRGGVTERLTRKQRQERTRSHLLEAAGTVFARRGFAHASVDQVAAEAGYTKGAFYANFASKEELFLVLLEQRFAERVAALDEVLAGDEDPGDAARAAATSSSATSPATRSGSGCSSSSPRTRRAPSSSAASSSRATAASSRGSPP